MGETQEINFRPSDKKTKLYYILYFLKYIFLIIKENNSIC